MTTKCNLDLFFQSSSWGWKEERTEAGRTFVFQQAIGPRLQTSQGTKELSKQIDLKPVLSPNSFCEIPLPSLTLICCYSVKDSYKNPYTEIVFPT